MLGINSLLLWETHLSAEIPPFCVSLNWDGFFLRDCVSASPTHLSVFLLSFVVDSSSSSFQREMIHMQLQIWCMYGRK